MFARALPRLRSTAPRLLSSQRALLHSRVPLDYPLENGLGDFLSRDALKTIAVDWQEGVLDRLNQLARGTESETASVIQTVLTSSTKPDEALLFNYASEALNNSFFLSTLSPSPSAPSPSSDFTSALRASPLGSISGLISHFSAHVAGLHPSSGAYVWLVTDPSGNLGVVGTYAGGTVLVHQRQQVGPASFRGKKVVGEVIEVTGEENVEEAAPVFHEAKVGEKAAPVGGAANLLEHKQNSAYNIPTTNFKPTIGKTLHPLLCLNVHPHCYVADYGVWGREEYTRRWWAHVDWKQVEQTFREFRHK